MDRPSSPEPHPEPRFRRDPSQPHRTPDGRALPGPLDLPGKVFVSFMPGAMPRLSRLNYRRELVSTMFLPWALGAIEGGVLGFIMRRLYEGVVPSVLLNYTVALLVAAPALANVSSFVWVRLSHGRDKIRFINAMQTGIVAAVFAIALAPHSPAGLAIVVLAALGARFCMAGVVTLRSTVWGANYPRSDRARVTGKLTTVQVLLVALAGLVVGSAMEWNEAAYRVILPVGGLLALVGIATYRTIRVRGHRRLLAMERAHNGDERPSFNPLAMRRIYLADRRYDAFMACQNLIGVGNMMTWAPLVIMVESAFRLGYGQGVMITHTLPLLMMPLFIPMWARLMDRSHIVRFRAIHSWSFVAMSVAIFIGGLSGLVWVLYIASVIRGIAFGGGAMAWNLGHHDFAPEDKVSQYMSIHVTVTGIRGLIAPFLGVSLYQLFEQASPGAGPWVFAISAAMVAAGAVAFAVLHRSMERERREAADEAPDALPA